MRTQGLSGGSQKPATPRRRRAYLSNPRRQSHKQLAVDPVYVTPSGRRLSAYLGQQFRRGSVAKGHAVCSLCLFLRPWIDDGCSPTKRPTTPEALDGEFGPFPGHAPFRRKFVGAKGGSLVDDHAFCRNVPCKGCGKLGIHVP